MRHSIPKQIKYLCEEIAENISCEIFDPARFIKEHISSHPEALLNVLEEIKDALRDGLLREEVGTFAEKSIKEYDTVFPSKGKPGVPPAEKDDIRPKREKLPGGSAAKNPPESLEEQEDNAQVPISSPVSNKVPVLNNASAAGPIPCHERETPPNHPKRILCIWPGFFKVEDSKSGSGVEGKEFPPGSSALANLPAPDLPKEPSRELDIRSSQNDPPSQKNLKMKRSDPASNKGDETRIASPQAENGHTDIANEIIEAFYKLRISGNQWRILWVIIRQTYGWKKKTDRISVSFFQKKTGLKRRHVSRALKTLNERKIITKNGASSISIYGFQKDYTKWELSPKKVTARVVSPKMATKLSPKMVHTKENKKKLSLREISDEISVLVQQLFPTEKERELFNQTIKAISSVRKTGRVSPKVILTQLKAWEKYPVAQVLEGMRVYLSKGYYRERKKENYLLGIIRNLRLGEVPADGFGVGGRKEETKSNEELRKKYERIKPITVSTGDAKGVGKEVGGGRSGEAEAGRRGT